jgi:hypothetical protein
MIVAALVHWRFGFSINWFGHKQGQGFECHILAIGMALSLIVSGGAMLSLARVVLRHMPEPQIESTCGEHSRNQSLQYEEVSEMLYLAFVKNRPQFASKEEIVAKSRKWWNEGGKPTGLKISSFYGVLGSDTPDVVVFDASNHEDIRTMIEYWREVQFEVHPAVDLPESFRAQGMKID